MKNTYAIDIDDTLLSTRTAKRYAAEVTASYLNHRLGASIISAATISQARKNPAFRSVVEGRRWSLEWLLQRIRLTRTTSSALGRDLYDLFLTSTWNMLELNKLTLSFLSFTSRYFDVFISTNGSHSAHPLLLSLPVKDIVTSAVLGARKPSPTYFVAFIDFVKCKPNNLITVGNDFAHDIAPALRVGATGGIWSTWGAYSHLSFYGSSTVAEHIRVFETSLSSRRILSS